MLYGIQVTRNKSCSRIIEKAAIDDLYKRVGITSSQFTYILCSTPKLAGKYKVQCPENMKNAELWNLPDDYGLSQISSLGKTDKLR